MHNDYTFWNSYLEKITEKMIELCDENKNVYVDLHIHSSHSADGSQNLEQILKNTRTKGFDIIAITDHDSIFIYNELYDIVKNGLTMPIIIPGVEFTIDNNKYGNQCHLLQLFINPKDDKIIEKVKYNYESTFNRSKIQFKRLKENEGFQEIIKQKNVKISYESYIKYINKYNLMPEYDTLGQYLMCVMKKHKINNFEVLDVLEKYNDLDYFEDRKRYKKIRYNKLRNKYEYCENNFYNTRFLISMLAIKEVDDDWWPKPSSGSLSVNSYGQLKIDELNFDYPVFWAHPTESKLNVVEEQLKLNNKIIGLEKNKRNKYKKISNFNSLIKKYNLCKIIGSDSHNNSGEFYEDMSYYKINAKEFKKMIIEVYNGKN